MTQTEKRKQEWFDQLYRSRYRLLYNHAFWRFQNLSIPKGIADELSHDAVQMTFAALWKNADTMLQYESPDPWLFAVLKNKIVDLIREECRIDHLVTLLKGDLDEGHPNELVEAEFGIFLEQLLTEDERALLQRIYVDRDRPSDICEEKGMKRSALSMRLRRIRAKIEVFYKK